MRRRGQETATSRTRWSLGSQVRKAFQEERVKELLTRRIKYGRESEQTDRMFLIGKRLGSFENGLLDLVKGSSLVNFLKAK